MATVTKRDLLQAINGMSDDADVTDICAQVHAIAGCEGVHPPPLYTGWRWLVSRVVIVIAAVAAVVTLSLLATDYWTPASTDKRSFFVVYALWALLPPLWFSVEYAVVFDALRGNATRVQDLKTAQELAQRFWAALLIVLGVFALVNWGAKF